MSVNELMTGLADSVRLKTGITDKMTLEQIAAAITSITVSGDLGFTSGTFVASSASAKTIEHNLGHVPGAIIFLKKSSANTSVPSASGTTVYDSLASIVFGAESGHAYSHAYARRNSSGGSSSTTTNRYWSYSANVPDTVFGVDKSTAPYYVTNINENTFTTPRNLHSGKTYVWIAFRAPLA